MNIPAPEYTGSTDYSDIVSEGMVETRNRWVHIKVTVTPSKETEKAYYGMIRVDEVIPGEKNELFYKSSITSWVPKSMADNPWWILTKKFDETRKVANRVFDKNKPVLIDKDEYDPYLAAEEYG